MGDPTDPWPNFDNSFRSNPIYLLEIKLRREQSSRSVRCADAARRILARERTENVKHEFSMISNNFFSYEDYLDKMKKRASAAVDSCVIELRMSKHIKKC